MADDFQVDGAEDFLRLSKALKRAGRTEMRKHLNAQMKKAAKPLIAKSKAEALKTLPQRGGLARQIAREPQRIQVRTGTNTAGVRIVVGRRAGGARSTNRGFVRHPVFGNRDHWVTQKVPSGWFDDTMRAGAKPIRREVIRAIDDVANQIVRDAGGRAR